MNNKIEYISCLSWEKMADRIWEESNQPELRSLLAVHDEMRRAMKKHKDFPSVHHGFGVITEEYLELADAVRSDNLDEIKKEATQLAAMGLRLLCYLEKKEYERASYLQELQEGHPPQDEASAEFKGAGDSGSVLHQMRKGIQVKVGEGVFYMMSVYSHNNWLLTPDITGAHDFSSYESSRNIALFEMAVTRWGNAKWVNFP